MPKQSPNSPRPKTKPLVTALVLNYNAPLETLKICLESLEKQTYSPFEILLVDNGSPNKTAKKVEEIFPQVQVLELERNFGFAEGINRGTRQARGEFILLLNDDTQVEPNTTKELLSIIKKDEKIVGVAPKMMFFHNRQVFDSIGTLIDNYGAAFNMGIGQLDIGQYDLSERVFGVCFGAALLRKDAFSLKKVGPLDKNYFMYYEDVDWCYRANLLGYTFHTAPKAVVYHFHSASTKKFPFARKYYLIERNLLRTIIKNFELRKVAKICSRRLAAHIRNILTGRFRKASLKVIINFLKDLPRYLLVRQSIQSRRRIADKDIIKYSLGEKPCFDPVDYTPSCTLETLETMYRRLFQFSGNPKHLLIHQHLHYLNNNKRKFENGLLRERLKNILSEEPRSVLDFVEKLEE